MPEVTFAFEAHQPYRLNRQFSPEPPIQKNEWMDRCFDPLDRDVLVRAAERCYTPATEILLKRLDEGFSCAFSFSGTLLEQLERWSPDTLHLFDQVARHRNVELIAQTYYHSIAGVFQNLSEFEEQVRQHLALMKDLFGQRPSVFANTELTFNNAIARAVRDLGISAIYAEGTELVLGGRNPNHVYSCEDTAVLLRNTHLSDDIALRFADRSWDRYPLTADTYADWLAGSPGEVVTLFLNYETFGEHIGQETGILDFLAYLPEACRNREITVTLPSRPIEEYRPAGPVSVPETISWADIEKDTSAWMGNDSQRTACASVQRAGAYAGEKKIWRLLQSIDHFYAMASRYGSSGEPHTFLSHLGPQEAFDTYMRILAEYEDRSMRSTRNRKAARILRTVPPDLAFQFSSAAEFIGKKAYDLDRFLELLKVVPQDSIAYHQERGDFERWIRDVLDDPKLAETVQECADRQELVVAIQQESKELWKRLK